MEHDQNDPSDASVDAAIAAHPILEDHLYKRPSHYIGDTFPNHFGIVGRHRDSDTIEDTNYTVALRMLQEADPGRDDDECNIIDHRASHWAVGWVETIYVRADAPPVVLAVAADILEQIERYPVLDENALSEAESELQDDCWDNYGRDAFVDEILGHGYRVVDGADEFSLYRRHCGGCYPECDGRQFAFGEGEAAASAVENDDPGIEPDPESDHFADILDELIATPSRLVKLSPKWVAEAIEASPEHADAIRDAIARHRAWQSTPPLFHEPTGDAP